MKKGLFILAALLCLIVTGALAEPEIIYEDETIVIKQDTVSRDKSVYHVLYVDIDSPEQLRSATAGEKGTKKTATVLSMAEQNNALCAMNGDYFTNRTTGYEVRNGEVHRQKFYQKRDLLVIDENADLHIIKKSSSAELKAVIDAGHTVEHAFTFGPALVIDGELQKISRSYDFAPLDNAPRSAIGQLGELSYVMVVVDGRQKGYSIGVPVWKMADFMFELGCQQAFSLDGGGSATLVALGEEINQQPKGARSISDIIYFKSGLGDEE